MCGRCDFTGGGHSGHSSCQEFVVLRRARRACLCVQMASVAADVLKCVIPTRPCSEHNVVCCVCVARAPLCVWHSSCLGKRAPFSMHIFKICQIPWQSKYYCSFLEIFDLCLTPNNVYVCMHVRMYVAQSYVCITCVCACVRACVCVCVHACVYT